MKEPLIAGRYRLLEILGTGGEAKVWRARDTFTEHAVAARVALQPSVARVMAELPPYHPGWVHLLDSGSDPRPWQIFELLDGPTLQHLVKSGPLEPEAWLAFVRQSLDAIEALHNAGWVHGDLNAGNFMLITPGGRQWKLLELPFVRFTPTAGRSALFGSIHTLAPEQIDGAPATIATDLYALGCLYYCAAAGQYPHHGVSSSQIAIERLRFDPAPLAPKAPQLASETCSGVMTLLARSPQNRPADVAAARLLLGIA